jgi:hypothetical protein
MTETDAQDLLLDADGDLVVDTDAALVAGRQAIAQGLRSELLMIQGEWFANLDAGLPWFTQIFGAKDLARVRQLLGNAIAARPGVRSLDELQVALDENRHLTVSYSVSTIFGQLTDYLTEAL